MAKIIITADDAGAFAAIDDSIWQLLERGVVTRVAAFPNGPTFTSFAHRTPRSTPILPHLTLTYGCPLGPQDELTDLLNEFGAFREPRDFYTSDVETAVKDWCNTCLSAALPRAVERELVRQMKHFCALTGYAGTDATFHHDIDAFVSVDWPIGSLNVFNYGRAGSTREGRLAGAVSRFLPDGTGQSDANIDAVNRILSGLRLSESVGGLPVEVVFHPALGANTLSQFTIYSSQRLLEHNALLSDGVSSILCAASRCGDQFEIPCPRLE